MSEDVGQFRARLRTPRAAAIAGVLFAVLLMTSQLLIWLSIPSDPMTAPMQAVRNSKVLALALNLLPFAGIAFLWFIAVVRDRIGELEDRFFATVFLGSGLLYVAMMFVSAAIAGALIGLVTNDPNGTGTSAAYLLGRAQIYRISTVFQAKMAGVFMFSTSTIFVRTQVMPRALAIVGYVCGVLLLLSIGRIYWVAAIFPLWVILISAYILQRSWKQTPTAETTAR